MSVVRLTLSSVMVRMFGLGTPIIYIFVRFPLQDVFELMHEYDPNAHHVSADEKSYPSQANLTS